MVKYIVIEGTDASGKGYDRELMKEYLETKGLSVFVLEEIPTHSDNNSISLGSFIRNMLNKDNLTKSEIDTLNLLFTVNRIQYQDRLKQALNDYDVVIQDRGIISTLVYGNKNHNRIINEVNNVNDILEPDLIWYMDTPTEVIAERLKNQDDELDVFESVDFDKINSRKALYEAMLPQNTYYSNYLNEDRFSNLNF